MACNLMNHFKTQNQGRFIDENIGNEKHLYKQDGISKYGRSQEVPKGLLTTASDRIGFTNHYKKTQKQQ